MTIDKSLACAPTENEIPEMLPIPALASGVCWEKCR